MTMHISNVSLLRFESWMAFSLDLKCVGTFFSFRSAVKSGQQHRRQQQQHWCFIDIRHIQSGDNIPSYQPNGT